MKTLFNTAGSAGTVAHRNALFTPCQPERKVALEDISDLPIFWFSRSANPSFYDKCESYFDTLKTPLKRIKEPDDTLVMLSRIARGKDLRYCLSRNAPLIRKDFATVNSRTPRQKG